ncbi:rRNA maturation RNase YbeY [uncultured Helicobacter sp.]|uniref:rRNA maturation RNase YbeY n=1 Tax=uncultured Helicobacter sp. TaxID=175537 RepID=UPI0025F6CFC7|nr:rRNA maturation RNase YbeY [uncultured Helicobacter sp.]
MAKAMPTLDICKEHYASLGFLESLLARIGDLGVIQGDFSAFSLEVLANDNPSMQKLNLQTRGKDSATDVLSFPLHYDDICFQNICADSANLSKNAMGLCLGSVVINVELAQSVAQRLGHSTQDEIALLFIHGFLHILGYDHEVDNGEQRALEQKIIESLDLGESLIVRESI